MRSLFYRGQRKAKKKNQKLCDLCDSAVNKFLLKTLLGSPSSFLGVVFDLVDEQNQLIG
jgi:hypothetical protein